VTTGFPLAYSSRSQFVTKENQLVTCHFPKEIELPLSENSSAEYKEGETKVQKYAQFDLEDKYVGSRAIPPSSLEWVCCSKF